MKSKVFLLFALVSFCSTLTFADIHLKNGLYSDKTLEELKADQEPSVLLTVMTNPANQEQSFTLQIPDIMETAGDFIDRDNVLLGIVNPGISVFEIKENANGMLEFKSSMTGQDSIQLKFTEIEAFIDFLREKAPEAFEGLPGAE